MDDHGPRTQALRRLAEDDRLLTTKRPIMCTEPSEISVALGARRCTPWDGRSSPPQAVPRPSRTAPTPRACRWSSRSRALRGGWNDCDDARHLRPDRAGRVHPNPGPEGSDTARRPRVRVLPDPRERSSLAVGVLARTWPVREDVGDDARQVRGLSDSLPSQKLSGLADRSATSRPRGAQYGTRHHSRHA